MKILVPKYYENFRCIADKCKDNCCIGWEIDVDDFTLERYKSIEGDEGERVMSTLNLGEPTTFKLGENERCANLDCHGLCKIISNLGEDYLCQICRDHPRYFNRVIDNYEGGLGLACEEAARLILTTDRTSDMVTVEYPEINPRYICEDETALKARGLIFDYLDSDMRGDDVKVAINRLLEISSRLDAVILGNLFSKVKEDVSPSDLQSQNLDAACDDVISIMCSAFDDAEALTDDFHARLRSAKEAISREGFFQFADGVGRKCFVNLVWYFVHRYFLCGEADYVQSMAFAIGSALIICAAVYVGGDYAIENFVVEAKDFSKNVEYSEENVVSALENVGEILRFY